MHGVLLGLSIFVFACTLFCTLIIVIDAFQYEVWAGLLALAVPMYLIYWAVFEFEHERKWLIVGGYLGGVFFSALFFELAMGGSVARPHSFTGFG